jgi:hypothetical protein
VHLFWELCIGNSVQFARNFGKCVWEMLYNVHLILGNAVQCALNYGKCILEMLYNVHIIWGNVCGKCCAMCT